MFRRRDQLVVTQFEHSRLSGQLAVLLGQALRYENPELCGAIALHDWPHFSNAWLADTIAVGAKTDAQQRELVQRLRGDLGLDAYTELIVRMHWRRLSGAEHEDWDAVSESRIADLLAKLSLDRDTAEMLDEWTDACDALSFYLSRGDEAEGELCLATPEPHRYRLRWQTESRSLLVRGVREPMECVVPLLAFGAAGYPDVLVPVMGRISCRFHV